MKEKIEETELLEDLYNCKAILKGHFLLSSGLHSDMYIQCALLMKNPKLATKFASALIEKIPEKVKNKLDLIVSPALGGLIIGYEVARLLNKEFMFFERVAGEFQLRRGFVIEKNQRVLLVEDVVTTAGSSVDVLRKILELGGLVISAASIIDRSSGCAKKKFEEFGCHFVSTIELECNIFNASSVPQELKDIPCVKPGSNTLHIEE
ncbi:orotate phosphoribosyltransferase [Neorickettsia helminthoeca str. Oregon]|uniref:Orotate phosphoribosyltransferase n=1 Tax=Neorickettsia helminthoeca str. Oregon TaxID=1286528 RepID=X5H450_9RICK|nr:orotate phosphoribosyltransferase [Neorickettsia helminthoeca]AHX11458.1 orotate phosphoribosyltransferase [Neorickettsia helminthoeca str. Oregon]